CPVVEERIEEHALLEHDVGEARHAHELAHALVVAALAILDDFGLPAGQVALVEEGDDSRPIDLDGESKSSRRLVHLARHGLRPPPRARALFDDRLFVSLPDPKHDELGGAHRSHADLAHELAGVDHFRRIRLFVALHVERLVVGLADEVALARQLPKEARHGADDLLPQRGLVDLAYPPLSTLFYPALDRRDESPD